ncbi:hypothetical protein A2210_01690 [Candidatus Woesebacteria bacterium RIFOXYA1_FULL_40_18]|uniref:Uncharacterized protein n=2 Tax=Candidatus Woeseibacteriota TaxID=1752722 RepID=A0A1F8CKK6_9BACT|nr:MAG: hypothetical protein A2210_01690 [Candidatus Woesebacteria bacterium RIFOXYA1_FULL_40_18]OGM80882.1 MAG: hypothetical protein A2361_00200 [Candidatus Woesebacteria bacterium RIFOXYB1_FULL_40_26]
MLILFLFKSKATTMKDKTKKTAKEKTRKILLKLKFFFVYLLLNLETRRCLTRAGDIMKMTNG